MQERDLEFWDEDDWKQITSTWPNAVNRGFATRLRVVQNGGQPTSHAKPLKGFAISLWELWHRDGQRVVYTVEYASLTNHIDVLDAFKKNSSEGKKMRTSDTVRITARVTALVRRMAELKAELEAKRRGLH